MAARLRHYVSEHQDNWDQFVQPLTYAYNSQVHASTGVTPFSLTLSRQPPFPIVDRPSTAAPTLDDNITPSSRTMRVRLLKRPATMFDKADSRSARARAAYKRYADRSATHVPIFEKDDFVLIRRPPTEAKTTQERDENIAQSKLRYRMTGPYRVVSATPETVTIDLDGQHITVSNDRCMHDHRQHDSTRQEDADDITDTNPDLPAPDSLDPTNTNDDVIMEDIQPAPQTPRVNEEEVPPPLAVDRRVNDLPINDSAETVLREEPDPIVENAEAPTPAMIVNHRRNRDNTLTYQVRYSDDSFRIAVPPSQLSADLIDDYERRVLQLTDQPNTMRRRGRPRSVIPPISQPRHASSQPPAFLDRYRTGSSQGR